MNMQEMQSVFDVFSRKMVVAGHPSAKIIGQIVDIEIIEDSEPPVWDIWICPAKLFRDGVLTASLTERKLNNLLKTLPSHINIHKLNGEAWFQTTDVHWLKTWLYENRQSLGLHKRRPAPVAGFGKREEKS